MGKGLLLYGILFLSLLSAHSFGQTYLITDAGPDTTCSGTLFDSGGETGDYGINEDDTITIYSATGSAVQVAFLDFDFGWFDNLYIYDGPDPATSPLLVTLSAFAEPSGTYISTDTCLTFRFTSNNWSEGAGFAASCLILK